MKITVSGSPREVAPGITIQALIEQEQIETPEYVTVAVNDSFVDRDGISSRLLHENDRVEFVYFMGGGAAWA